MIRSLVFLALLTLGAIGQVLGVLLCLGWKILPGLMVFAFATLLGVLVAAAIVESHRGVWK